MKAAAALLLTMGLASCGAPTQYGGPIEVNSDGLAWRLRHVCGLGGTRESAQGGCALPEPAATQTEAAREGRQAPRRTAVRQR